ncbi:MAG: L(+)-tartrate dehydratase subunit beta [Candidatus Methanoperedenaceae archaeon GB50]|nr:MAG: L(+)-tartrate dehydratase subunit beta [Candidatus Methanoperedenaceae archaeon GB50]
MQIKTPLREELLLNLKAGDEVFISGTVYTARDAAHKRLVELIKKDEPLPFSLKGKLSIM